MLLNLFMPQLRQLLLADKTGVQNEVLGNMKSGT